MTTITKKQTVKVTRKCVTTPELIDVLLNTPDSIGSFARVTQFTNVKLLKKDRITKEPTTISELHKLSNLTVLLNTSYENGVVNALNKENKDESEYKRGQNTMPLDFTVSANNFCGLFYNKAVIQYRPFENSYPKTKYVIDGKIIDKRNLQDILPVKSKATNQGTTKEIFWRKLYVSNIRRIIINGVEYIVKN
tara:strand:+ start:30660 stop:31238 length:579 start_codon:yes stop_codon:yes gene_type:complete